MEALSEDGMEKRILKRFGYLLGRWIYFIDALDDLEDDLKEGGFNPFIKRFGLTAPLPPEKREEVRDYGRELLNITGAEMAQRMLAANGIYNVPIHRGGPDQDHFDPRTNSITM